jgi:hypothetical protein
MQDARGVSELARFLLAAEGLPTGVAIMRRRFVASLFALAFAFGCGGTVPTEHSSSGPEPGTGARPSPSHSPAFDGHGFVVHEWGTNTVVVGSDGSMQTGLEHEEEGLPAFVYDRVSGAKLAEHERVMSFDCASKLETPITYFYSDTPRTVDVRAQFPSGVFTQWYPAVEAFQPLLARPCPSSDSIGDPALDPAFPFVLEECRRTHGRMDQGVLDWGSVEILARDAEVTGELPPASLDEYTWSYARAVAANPLRTAGAPGQVQAAELERFLFYRGLGNAELPVSVRAADAARLRLENRDADMAVGAVFVLNVGADRGSFTAHFSGIPAGQTLEAEAPSLDQALSLDGYTEELASTMKQALEASGLYRDEAESMVNTWRRQWFKTPGVRVLYLLPQSWTDRMIPLTIAPRPDTLVRTVVIRVEVLTADIESTDLARVRELGAGESERSAAEQHFLSLGRFAEPRLRRAIALSGDTHSAMPLLARLSAAPAGLAAGE